MNKLKKRLHKPDRCELSQSDINHLRRLLAWLRCENAYTYVDEATHKEIARSFEPLGEAAVKNYKERIEKPFSKWPKYVHEGVRALEKTIQEIDGEVTDVPAKQVFEIEDKTDKIRRGGR